MMIVLRKDAFKEWLESMDDAAVVGKTQSICDCPIARWIKATRHYPEVRVNGLSFSYANYITGGGYYYQADALPAWARSFIKSVDTCETDRIPARFAKAVLAAS